MPAALEMDMGICPWSPLAGGLLTGKYKRNGEGEGRLQMLKDNPNPAFKRLTERNQAIIDTVVAVSRELNRSPAQVALNWVTRRPAVTSTIIGATKLEQLDDNLHALEFDIPTPLAARLEEAGRPESVFPYMFFEPTMRAMIDGGAKVVRRHAAT